MARQLNYVALAAGILSLILIAVSVFVPWWVFTVGDPAIATVNFSPVNFNFSLFDTLLVVPLIWALNLACLLILLAGGVALLIYATSPTKPYAKPLLRFGYRKPLYAVLLFTAELAVLYFAAAVLTGAGFPLAGSSAMQLPTELAPGDISVSVTVSAAFGWTFYFAIAVASLCIAARVYHKKAVAQPAGTGLAA
ncbi:MAG: hypothetical protein ACQCN6_10175 [Candidatus Bathyarchaeia archaeon]|jgi:hypothetical protein